METLVWQIADTANVLRRVYDRRSSELGVTRAQGRALIWLNREPGLRQIELADRLDIEAITLCRIIDRLEEAGLVDRRRDPADRRAWRLHVTAAAEPVVTGLKQLAVEMAQVAFAGFANGEADKLSAALARICENLGAPEDPTREVVPPQQARA